jgi:HK97 family phage major capsid protein
MFVESAQFRSYEGHGSSGRVDLPLGLDELETRAPIDLASAWNTTNPLVYVPPPPQISTPLIGAVNSVTTSVNTISVLTYPGAPPDAAVVPEGTPKPEADYLPTEFTASLDTLAHWKPITRQALEDIPQIRSIVENALRAGIATKIDKTITDNLAAATLTAVGTTVDLDNIRIGIGTVQAAGYPNANTVLLNPTDWAALDIAVMGATSNGPQSAGNFWGLRPIASAGVPAGTAYVGDFKAGVTLFTRGSASVYLTDSHSDYFIRNILVVLAEARAKSVVTEARALVEIGTFV